MSSIQELYALAALINDSVKVIDESLKAENATLPSLGQLFKPGDEIVHVNPTVQRASSDIVAVAAQLTALVRPPALTILTTAMLHHKASALRLVAEANIPEVLREAGAQGFHIDEIANKAQVNSTKLVTALRLLATEHIFSEPSPDFFANNRISSMLDTGKSVKDILKNPSAKHNGSSGISAFVSAVTNHTFKASSYMTDAILNPEYNDSFELNKTAFNLAINTDQKYFDWMDQPENKDVLKAFSIGMAGFSSISSPTNLLSGFEWSELPEGSVVVDVGGGIGSQSMILARAYSNLRFVVQDRQPTLRQAENYWQENFPEAINNGRVVLRVQDFFDAQKITNASVFYIRYVLHGWPDCFCTKILRNLRQAALSRTRLVVVDNILAHACPQTIYNPHDNDTYPPAPLLLNAGHASLFGYLVDYHLMAVVHGRERTLSHLNRILTATGWKIDRIIPTPYAAGGPQQIIALPA